MKASPRMLFGLVVGMSVLASPAMITLGQEAEMQDERYAYLLRLTPKYQAIPDSLWSESDQQIASDHFAHLMSYAARGNVEYLGRSFEDPHIRFGIVIFKGLTEDEVREIGEADPVIKNHIMTVQIHRFRTIVPGT